jgi:branched-chain amino acid transport system substrate-binding protein
MKHIFLLKPVFGIFLIQWLLFAACQKNDPVVNPVSNEIRLGAILDLSGLYSEEGKAGKAVTDAVISDINQRYQSVGSPVRFSVIYKDSGLDSIKSLAAVKELYNAGVRLLVAGPSTSADLKSIRPFIEANNILVLTCFSSAPALAIPGDNIFRIITDDNVQGRATAKMMQTDGIRAIVPVWCDDTYGNGLQETVKQHFMASGGVVYNGVKYTTGSVTFSSVLQNASEQVAEASKEFGADKVGVLLISFQDASDFFKAASTISELSSVRWYGCDANTKKVAVTDNPEAAAFALKVRFVAPIMAIGTASSVPAVARSLAARVKAVTGSDPDDMALSAYDAVMIYGQCYNLAQSSDVAVIKTLLPSVCASYNYLGISRTLNAAGDLATANYIFWTVNPNQGGWAWESYCTWFADGDYIILKP